MGSTHGEMLAVKAINEIGIGNNFLGHTGTIKRIKFQTQPHRRRVGGDHLCGSKRPSRSSSRPLGCGPTWPRSGATSRLATRIRVAATTRHAFAKAAELDAGRSAPPLGAEHESSGNTAPIGVENVQLPSALGACPVRYAEPPRLAQQRDRIPDSYCAAGTCGAPRGARSASIALLDAYSVRAGGNI